MKYLILASILCFVFMACQPAPPIDESVLTGNWFSTQWDEGEYGTTKRAWITFEEESEYRAVLNNKSEGGIYSVSGSRLKLTTNTKTSTSFTVEQPSADTLILSGTIANERCRITLVKK